MQLPAVHVSAFVASHEPQEPPAMPHAVTENGVQTPLLQHPVGHDVESHWQAPFKQRCPAAQPATLPHEHSPLVHDGARCGSHVLHDAPLAPHVG